MICLGYIDKKLIGLPPLNCTEQSGEIRVLRPGLGSNLIIVSNSPL
jgi:hypothetical protein